MDNTKLVIVMVVLLSAIFFVNSESVPMLGSSGQAINSGNASSTSRTLNGGSAGVAANIIFAANSGVELRCITNHGTSTVTLGFGTSTGLTGTQGYVLGVPTSTVVFTGDTLYTGIIYGFTVGSGTIVSTCQL